MTEIESFFDDRIISKTLWPPRSPDLSPPDFFLWGALKGKAYANKPRTIQELENNIRREIAAISEDVLQATFANMKRRFSSAWTVVANISSISSSIDMLFMKQGM